MLKKLPHLLIWMLLAACQAANINDVTQTIPAAAFATATAPVTTTPATTPTATLNSTSQPDTELDQLAQAYLALRDIPGHFDGADPNPVVDQWQGEKHRLMLELGSRLGTGEYGRSELVALLGPPDHIVAAGDSLYKNIESLPSFQTFADSEAFLIYEWRGTHDFLFFAVQNGRVVGSDWWYAGE